MSTVDDHRPASKIGALRALVIALLKEHEADGTIPTNARFLFYELVQRGQINKHPTGKRRADQDLSDALTDVREAGLIPWDWLVDETRSLEDYTGYASVRDGLLAKLPHTDLDCWRGRSPMILTEARATAGVLRHIVWGYRGRIAPTNGQVGGFLHTNIAHKLQVGGRVLYIGDWDHAGNQIEANTRRVLEQAIGGELAWERLALTTEQVDRYDLPKIIKRDRRYKDGRPHEAVETEAISQRVLIDILRSRLDELLPEPLGRVQEREVRQRRTVAALLRGKR